MANTNRAADRLTDEVSAFLRYSEPLKREALLDKLNAMNADACPICGTVAPLSDATEHSITWDEPVCDECRQRARDAMHGPQTRYDISGD